MAAIGVAGNFPSVPYSQRSCVRTCAKCIGITTLVLGILALSQTHVTGFLYAGIGLSAIGVVTLLGLYLSRESGPVQVAPPQQVASPQQVAPHQLVAAEADDDFLPRIKQDKQSLLADEFAATREKVKEKFEIPHLGEHLTEIYGDEIPTLSSTSPALESELTILLCPDIFSLPISCLQESEDLLDLIHLRLKLVDDHPSAHPSPPQPTAPIDFSAITVGELRSLLPSQHPQLLSDLPPWILGLLSRSQILDVFENTFDNFGAVKKVHFVFPINTERAFERTKENIRQLPPEILSKIIGVLTMPQKRMLSNSQLKAVPLNLEETMEEGFQLLIDDTPKCLENTRRILSTIDKTERGKWITCMIESKVDIRLMPPSWLEADWFPWEKIVDRPGYDMKTIIPELGNPILRNLFSSLIDNALTNCVVNCSDLQLSHEEFPWKEVATEVRYIEKRLGEIWPKLSMDVKLTILPHLHEDQLEALTPDQVNEISWKEVAKWPEEEIQKLFSTCELSEHFLPNLGKEAITVLLPHMSAMTIFWLNEDLRISFQWEKLTLEKLKELCSWEEGGDRYACIDAQLVLRSLNPQALRVIYLHLAPHQRAFLVEKRRDILLKELSNDPVNMKQVLEDLVADGG